MDFVWKIGKYSEICTRYWFSNKIGFKRIKMTQK